MKYMFILGRNPELSKVEIVSFLKKSNIEMFGLEQVRNAILVDLEKELEKGTIEKLGGAISMGQVLCKADSKELEKNMLYFGTKNKMNYVLWNFSLDNSYNKISDYLKKRFRDERLKAAQKPLTRELELQDGKKSRVSAGLIDEEYFVFNNYFGRITEKCNYKELEFRDMKKPTRRQELSVSPRIAKIMINLSLVKEGEVLLDCFCGIGAILMEALLQGINVVGIDRDRAAIQGAKQNFDWLKFSEENYELIVGDSKVIRIHPARVIVTEPDLGDILKKVPSKEQAEAMLRKYESLMIRAFNNVKKNISGRIVFTAPLIKQRRGRSSCRIDKICQKQGSNLYIALENIEKNRLSAEIFLFWKDDINHNNP